MKLIISGVTFSAAAKITFVFTIFIVNNYDYFPLTDVFFASIVLSCILFLTMIGIYFLDGNNFWNSFGTDLK
jgi:hypothetical protein